MNSDLTHKLIEEVDKEIESLKYVKKFLKSRLEINPYSVEERISELKEEEIEDTDDSVIISTRKKRFSKRREFADRLKCAAEGLAPYIKSLEGEYYVTKPLTCSKASKVMGFVSEFSSSGFVTKSYPHLRSELRYKVGKKHKKAYYLHKKLFEDNPLPENISKELEAKDRRYARKFLLHLLKAPENTVSATDLYLLLPGKNRTKENFKTVLEFLQSRCEIKVKKDRRKTFYTLEKASNI